MLRTSGVFFIQLLEPAFLAGEVIAFDGKPVKQLGFHTGLFFCGQAAFVSQRQKVNAQSDGARQKEEKDIGFK